jgi:hypothetical protein
MRGDAVRLRVALLILVTVNADARSRWVIIYPLTSDHRQFTFTAYGGALIAVTR